MSTETILMDWRPIETFEGDGVFDRVDLWLSIYASPRSMGMADHFRVCDCWRENGKWVHRDGMQKKELFADYISHWMPRPLGPNGEEWD